MKFNERALMYLASSAMPSDKASYLYKRGAFMNTGKPLAAAAMCTGPSTSVKVPVPEWFAQQQLLERLTLSLVGGSGGVGACGGG